MDSWILKNAGNLVNEPFSENIESPTQVKVKVSHLLLTEYDALLYSGSLETAYPRVIGRTAIGIVTEAGENCYGLERGTRVFFEPTRACGKCLPCKNGEFRECADIQYAGKDFDGFMRDFVVCEYNEVSPLPDSVDNLTALCIENAGIAENIYNKLNLTAGQRVAIIGGNYYGNVMAQVLQYHKVIPIIIDNTPANLERAKKCGIFHAFAADDEILENVKSATMGKLCDAAIYCATSELPISICSRIVGNDKSIVLTSSSVKNLSIDMRSIIEKNIKVFGVSNAYGFTDSVINMLTHGAVNIDLFERQVLTDFDPAAILDATANNAATVRSGKLIILKMVL